MVAQKFFAALFLAGVLFLGVFNVFSGHMANGHMPTCPFMGMSVMCEMSPFEYVSALQSFFAVPLEQGVAILLLLSLVALSIVLVVKVSLRRYLLRIAQFTIAPPHEVVPLRMLQDLFARGILNPKLF